MPFNSSGEDATISTTEHDPGMTANESVVKKGGTDEDDFCGAHYVCALVDVGGTLYGTSEGGSDSGFVFSFDPNSGAEKVIYRFCSRYNCSDGAHPYAGMLNVNAALYGTTSKGGTYGGGTVFRIDPATGSETMLYSFCNLAQPPSVTRQVQQACPDGANPYGGLIDVNGKLYGTTYNGGANGYGTVFSLMP